MADNPRTLQYLLDQTGALAAALRVECPPELHAALPVPTPLPPLQARRNVFAQVDIGRAGDTRKARISYSSICDSSDQGVCYASTSHSRTS